MCSFINFRDRLLGKIFDGDEELVRHYLEFMGYGIQPSRRIAAWFLLRGQGANGKTALMETLQRLMGQDTVVSDRIDSIEGSPFKIGALAGKLLLVDDDVSTGTVLPDGFLKKTSERKAMTGQHKFKDQFNFVSCCLPVLLANHMPSLKDLSYGTRRRAHVIPFRVRFGQEIPQDKGDVVYCTADPAVFRKIWAEEMPGVLALAVRGFQRLLKRGAFDEPAACIDARDKWLAEANPLVKFISEECETSADARQPTRQFYAAYVAWRMVQGFRNHSVTQTKVTRDLQALSYPVVKSNGERWVHGVVAPTGTIGTFPAEPISIGKNKNTAL